MRKDIRDTDLAYIAGLVDGEGNFGWGKSCLKRKSEGSPNHYTRWFPRISIANTDYGMLLYLQAMFGGSIGTANRGKEDNNRKQAWTWAVERKHAFALNRAIKPWLKTKVMQSDVFSLWEELNPQAYAKKKYLEIAAAVELLIEELRYFNQRGDTSNRNPLSPFQVAMTEVQDAPEIREHI